MLDGRDRRRVSEMAGDQGVVVFAKARVSDRDDEPDVRSGGASREAAQRMRARASGSIVNIASVSGVRGNSGRVAYGCSKAAVIHMTKVMAVELGPSGIRVNAIAPGPVETPLVKEVHTDQARAAWMRTVPQRRYGTPDELAGAATFLLDERKSSYITGQTICVDGGFTAAGIMAGSA